MIDMKLVLIGAPGAGKGTQGSALVERYNIVRISTGDILREAVAKETELGKQVKDIIAVGGLVSDEIIIAIVKERIKQDDCANGFILDGFPRTQVQAQKFEKMVEIDKAIYIEVPDELLLDRLTARQTCLRCGSTYNRIHKPSKKKGFCDVCHNKLVQRSDDTIESGVKRIQTFHDQSETLVTFYQEKGLLVKVDGTESISEITNAIIKGLEQ
ncbi:adenylate kinase [Chakrabartyella piscis]|uniref:adenylate kinase n=1 Tax=Chakrabartyella piscis TaxID=2918914 RepID=UPI002958BF03|nr:adenylate kinase [Chakrabartyella piscis]